RLRHRDPAVLVQRDEFGERAVERRAEGGAILGRRAVNPDLEESGDDTIAGLEARDIRADGDNVPRAIRARNRIVVDVVAVLARDDGVVAVIERSGAN